jgi:hypothetical protein
MLNTIVNLTLPPVFNQNQLLIKNDEDKFKKQYPQDLTQIKQVVDSIKSDSLSLLQDIFHTNLSINKELKAYESNNSNTITKDNIVTVISIKIAKNTVNDWKNGTSREDLLKDFETKQDEINNNFNNLQKDVKELSKYEQEFINDTVNKMKESLINLKESLQQASNKLRDKASDNIHTKFSLDITTKDGDSIRVNMSQDRKYTSDLNIEFVDEIPKFNVYNNVKEISDVKVKVDGELDSKEQKLLTSVVNGVNNILKEWKLDNTPTNWGGYLHAMNLDETQISKMYSSGSYSNDNIKMNISGGGNNPNQIDTKQYTLNKELNKILQQYENSFKKLINTLMKIESIKTDPEEVIKDIGKSIIKSEQDNNVKIF